MPAVACLSLSRGHVENSKPENAGLENGGLSNRGWKMPDLGNGEPTWTGIGGTGKCRTWKIKKTN